MKTTDDFIRNFSAALANVTMRAENRCDAHKLHFFEHASDIRRYNERLAKEVKAECEELQTTLNAILKPR